MENKKHLSSQQMRLHFGKEQKVRREDGITMRCMHCDKRFVQPRWYIEKGIRSLFCSNKCRTHWESDEDFELVLEGRPEYRGGNWKIQANKARMRDEFCCASCGVTEDALGRQMDVHHKIPYRLFDSPKEANKLSNLISLCPSCHRKMERTGQADMPLFNRVQHRSQRKISER